MSPESFRKVVSRIRQLDDAHAAWYLFEVYRHLRRNKTVRKFPIPLRSGEYRIIPCKSLLYAEADGNYTILWYFYQNRLLKHIYSYNIGALKTMLCEAGMYAIHKSYLINPAHLEELNIAYGNRNYAILTGGKELPLSHPCAARLRRYFDNEMHLSNNPFLSV